MGIRAICLFLTLLWCFQAGLSIQEKQHQIPDHSAVIQSFAEYVQTKMEIDRIPGLTIGFVLDDTTWVAGFGYADLENQIPARADSAYRLASVSKTITAIAVLQLAEAGKISLDAEVQAYVPYFPKKKWPVTIRQLLGHLGGISHYQNSARESHIKTQKNTRAALAIFQDFPLVAEPGTRYFYSSYGYNLLAAVVEGASGQSFADYIQEHIFQPLGMDQSQLDNPSAIIPKRVSGYMLVDGEIKNSEFVNISSRFGGGGARSTIADMLKFARGIWENRLLKCETYQMMATSMVTREGFFTGYGMGWRINSLKGHFQISHSGSQPETRTHLLIFPTERFAIAMAANLERSYLVPYVQRLMELILEQDLDSKAYIKDSGQKAIFLVCSDIQSHGMSQYHFKGNLYTENIEDLESCFNYFNSYVDPNYIQENPQPAKIRLEQGFHPIGNQVFVKIGAHMAQVLAKTFGEDRLQSYHQNPLQFFSDYFQIKDRSFRFAPFLKNLISTWEKDWSKTYGDFERYLVISPDTNFDELSHRWKIQFSQAQIYPDFSQDISNIAYYFYDQKRPNKSLELFKLSEGFYPTHAPTLRGLGFLYLTAGDLEKARDYYHKCHALAPISLNYFENNVRRFQKEEKIPDLIALLDIAMELYPKHARLRVGVAEMYLILGQKDRAIYFFQKAVELDPRLTRIKKRIQELKRR